MSLSQTLMTLFRPNDKVAKSVPLIGGMHRNRVENQGRAAVALRRVCQGNGCSPNYRGNILV
jgi:hypothetical protein